jgi:DNA polymerase III delta prime subunit
MENLNINSLLNREDDAKKIKTILKEFEQNKNNLTTKRGLYIYGDPGSGKTTFITNILQELNYDIIRYDAGDIRNKSIIDTITKHNMADRNIMSMFYKQVKRIAIIMDEIDGMNNGDKGGINSLIKIIRPKKTKKQRQEETTLNPIICIGNYHIDKKIKELMKVCHVIELKSPTKEQTFVIVKSMVPTLNNFISLDDEEMITNMTNYIQGDLRKIKMIYELCNNNKNILNNNIIKNIFLPKSYNDDTRKITKKLINNNYNIDEHLTIMNETDRTIVGLLWHENIIDVLSKTKKEESIPLYLELLDNMCFADYIDRITFQKQIWQFNEMSSLIKTFKNNNIYHNVIKNKQKFSPTEVRFTKVLTKYSTEYNNSVFIQNLCQELSMDKNDMFAFFLDLKNKYNDNEILALFENYDITKLDINRIYRYLEKYTKENAIEDEVTSDDESLS